MPKAAALGICQKRPFMLRSMQKTVLVLAALTAVAQASATPLTNITSGTAFIADSKARLLLLVGAEKYDFLRRELGHIDTLQNDRHLAAFSACKPHNCFVNDAIIIYDKVNDTLRVILHMSGKMTAYQEKGRLNTAYFSEDLRTVLSVN